MNNEHLTDPEIQRAAEHVSLVDALQQQHLEDCADCQLKIDNYRAIANSLTAMETPAFDFDLAAQVMAALPVKKTPYSSIPAFVAGLGALLIAVMVLVFGSRIYFLLAAMPAPLLYLAIIPAAVLLALQLIVAYRDHQRKMHRLINS